jgi:DNA-directed RNA polymerase subunit RPC12/RpoP
MEDSTSDCSTANTKDVCYTCGADALQLAAYDDVFWCPECGTLMGDYGPWIPRRLKSEINDK